MRTTLYHGYVTLIDSSVMSTPAANAALSIVDSALVHSEGRLWLPEPRKSTLDVTSGVAAIAPHRTHAAAIPQSDQKRQFPAARKP